MTIENQANDIISITVFDKDGESLSYNVSAELVREYYGQAAYQLAKEDSAKEAFKAEVEAFSETTKLPKAFVSAFFKKRYKEEIEAENAKSSAFSELNKAFD